MCGDVAMTHVVTLEAIMNAKIIYGTAWYAQFMSFYPAAKWFTGRRNELLR